MVRLFFLSVLFLIILTQLAGCKKNSSVKEKNEITFTYNGQTYTNIDTFKLFGGYSNFLGFEFYSHAVLGGKLHYSWITNPSGTTTYECAYIEPTGLDIFNDNTCTFFTGGTPVDSSKIYTYISGSKNFTFPDCKTETFLGQSTTYCTISGNFTLVLANNAGLTKTITGTFKFAHVPPN